jgi:hypothetical protein
MRTILKSIWLGVAFGAGWLGAAPAARADTTYFTTRQVLAEFFPKSDKVTYKQFTLADDQAARLKQKLGSAPAKKTYTFYVATTGDQVDGYALVDDELGQHQPITYGVKLSAAGAVERVEIMVYRESRGDEVRDKRFLKQFAGRTSRDALRLNTDVVAISGATISSNSMAVGVKRAVALFDECLAPAKTAAAAEAPGAAATR